MSFEDVCAHLVKRGVPLAAIWQMTRGQVRSVYFREWDEQGRLVSLRGEVEPPSRAEQLLALYRMRGWPEHKAAAKVRELLGAGG